MNGWTGHTHKIRAHGGMDQSLVGSTESENNNGRGIGMDGEKRGVEERG